MPLKKSIFVILNRLVVGGQTLDTLPLLNSLSDEFDILVLHGRKEKDEKSAIHLLQQYSSLKSKYIPALRRSLNPFTDILAFVSVYQIIIKNKPNIVHTHGSKSGLIGRIAARLAGVPVIIHTFHGHLFHSYYNSLITSLVKANERLLGKITNTAIAISEWQKKELCEIYKIFPDEKVMVIHLGVEPELINKSKIQYRACFRNKYNISEETIAIGFVGRLVPIKNTAMFIKVVYSLLNATKTSIKFFIIGDGYLKNQIQQQCKDLNIQWSEGEDVQSDTKLVFTSWIKDVIPAFHGIDILALTSHNEGTPMSIIEAQCCGKPVVATNVGGVRDTILDSVTGFLVNPGDVNAMISKLELLIDNVALRNEMALKAATFAATRFSKQQEVYNLRELYNSYPERS